MGDGAYGDRRRALVREQLLGHGQQRVAGLFVVLCRSTHVDSLAQRRYVTLYRNAVT